jgi:hypothetical protein
MINDVLFNWDKWEALYDAYGGNMDELCKLDVSSMRYARNHGPLNP